MATYAHHDRCRAFANEERVRLIACLSAPKSVSELQKRCTLSQSALSQHLKVLRDAGIVLSERAGRYIVYRVANPKMRTIARLLLEVEGEIHASD